MCKNCIKVFITITAILSICFSFTISSFAGFEIFFYDGTTTSQLTDNDYADEGARVNDSGEVVWYSRNLDVDGGGGGGGGFGNIGPKGPCIISIAAYGFRISKEIWTLALLFVSVLIVFQKIRAKFRK